MDKIIGKCVILKEDLECWFCDKPYKLDETTYLLKDNEGNELFICQDCVEKMLDEFSGIIYNDSKNVEADKFFNFCNGLENFIKSCNDGKIVISSEKEFNRIKIEKDHLKKVVKENSNLKIINDLCLNEIKRLVGKNASLVFGGADE